MSANAGQYHFNAASMIFPLLPFGKEICNKLARVGAISVIETSDFELPI
jgi:hypothetical protein